jgi:hypothetical protein
MIYFLLERAFVMRDVFGAAPESQPCAKVISPSIAMPAIVARDADFQRHPVADKISGHAFADSLDRPGRLVPQGQRRTCLEVSIAEMLVVSNVTAADSRASDRDLELAGTRIRKVSLLLASVSTRHFTQKGCMDTTKRTYREDLLRPDQN